jgi:hypothetical protein
MWLIELTQRVCTSIDEEGALHGTPVRVGSPDLLTFDVRSSWPDDDALLVLDHDDIVDEGTTDAGPCVISSSLVLKHARHFLTPCAQTRARIARMHTWLSPLVNANAHGHTQANTRSQNRNYKNT